MISDQQTSFADLGVPSTLTTVLHADGKTTPFPIQTDTLPDTLKGRDVLGRGKTGSGKTLAFSIPLVARLGEKYGRGTDLPGRPKALILSPTRELATQIDAVLAPLAAAYGMSTLTIFGGVSARPQISALRRGVDIVVACPGRLEDLISQDALRLDDVEVTVLDEADHMADLGFLPGVTRILRQTPENGQRLFFSATLDNGVDKLVKKFLTDEILHSVDEPTSHVSAMTHHVFEVDKEEKKQVVKDLASGRGRRILFTRTKHQAKKLAKQLTEQGVPAVDLHGNLSQPQRDRNLAAFGSGGVNVLCATDVAARGVHVDSVELVVHVDPPAEHKAYLHRSGRTARAGSSGDVVTVMLPEQRGDTEVLLRKAAISTQITAVEPGSEEITELVGATAPYVKPEPKQNQQPKGTSQGANAQRKRAARGSRGGGSSEGRSGASGSGGSRSGGSRSGGNRSGRSRPGRDGSPRAASGRRAGRNSDARSR